MSTIEDFENAPVGATATHDNGGRAVKIDDSERGWIIRTGDYWSDELIERWGYTLEPPAPTTAREALDLAWELAHEVKEGQNIPKDTRYLEVTRFGLKEYTAERGFWIAPAYVTTLRTVEPLSDPEPDWIDAPAVLATMDGGSYQEVWLPMAGGHWKCTCCHQVRHWSDLVDVTPLYPKEDDGEWVSL